MQWTAITSVSEAELLNLHDKRSYSADEKKNFHLLDVETVCLMRKVVHRGGVVRGGFAGAKWFWSSVVTLEQKIHSDNG